MTFAGPVYVGPSRNAVLVDVNGDNKLDLATVGWTGSQYNFSLYRNTSSGAAITFDPAVSFFVSNSPTNLYDISRGDFDGDGRLDVVIADRDTGAAFDSLVIFRNTGISPYFQLVTRVSEARGGGVGLAVADMDLDGKPDIVRTDRNDGRNGFIRIFKNRSSGPGNISFTDTAIATIHCPWNVVVADFSNDGYPDIAWPMNNSFGKVDSIAVLKNNGGGIYGPIFYYRLHQPFISQVEVGDFDGDSKTDLVFATDNGIAVTFLRNTSSGTGDIGFFVQDSISIGRNLRRHCVADVNGDGKPDVILPAPSGVVFILRNNSTGIHFSFTNVDSLGVLAGAIFAVGGDLNNDGRPDLVVAGGATSNTGMVYLMNTTPAAPDAPLLQSPGNNSVNVQLPVRFVWSASARATAYHLQIALTQDFSFPIVNDSALIDTSFQANTLAYNTTYYWRVASRTANGDGLYSPPRSFSTASTALLSGGIFFPANPTADTSYRLVSIPGISRFTVGDILSGAQTTDWRIFRENGAEPPNDLTELSASEQLKIGEGYLMLRKGTFSFSRTVQMPPVATNGTFGFPVEKKWILIGNPFEKAAQWQSVLAANNLSRDLYTYRGVRGEKDSVLLPFSGYLFDNNGGVDSLKFPYPFPGLTIPQAHAIPFSWKLQLEFESASKFDRENYIGISAYAGSGYDSLESRKPPLFLDKGTISFARPTWNVSSSLFATDFRPALGDGQVWEFDVRNDRVSEAKIRIIGIDQIPAHNEIVLVNRQNSVPADMRQKPEYEFQTVSTKMAFKLIVGRKEFIANQLQKDLPTEFRLEQNYPNPFNPTTEIRYQISEVGGQKSEVGGQKSEVRGQKSAVSYVTLKVYDVLGREVRTLVNENLQAGSYETTFDATGLASGVYLYRLRAGEFVQTRKLLLLR